MRVFATLLLLFVLLAPSRSSAASPEEQAAVIYKQAVKAMNAGRDPDAVAKMREAFEVFPSAEYICNVGSLELGMEHGAKAAEAFSKCLQVLAPSEAPLRATIERQLARAKALAATLMITANVAGAEVNLGGQVIGKTPLPGLAFVEPGRHVLELRAPGYNPEARILDLTAGSDLRLDINLEPAEVTAPPLPTAPKPPPPPATAPKPPPAPKLPAPPREPREGTRPRTAVLLTGFGMGVIGGALGAGGLVAAAAAKSEGDAMVQALKEGASWGCTDPDDGKPCFDVQGRYSAAVGFTALGVGGIALATAGGGLLAYELLRADAERGAPVCAVLVPSHGGAVVAFKGSW